jgi:hypothetical protein
VGRRVPLFILGSCLYNRELNCSHWSRLNLLVNIFIQLKLLVFFYEVFLVISFLFFTMKDKLNIYNYFSRCTNRGKNKAFFESLTNKLKANSIKHRNLNGNRMYLLIPGFLRVQRTFTTSIPFLIKHFSMVLAARAAPHVPEKYIICTLLRIQRKCLKSEYFLQKIHSSS